jgi:hypothetical protein
MAFARAARPSPAEGGVGAKTDPHEAPTALPPTEQKGSGVRVRIAPTVDAAAMAALALDYDTSTTSSTSPDDVCRLEERLLAAVKAGDLAAALTLASVIVYADPEHEVARGIKERCATQAAALAAGSTDQPFPRQDAVLRQRVAWSELTRRALSRNEAFLLSRIDGRTTVAELVDVSGMAPLAAFATLDSLVRDGIIDLV